MDPETLHDLLEDIHTIAVVGVSSKPVKAGYYVPEYLQKQGFRIIGVSPVLDEAFGERTWGTVAEIPEPVDLILVFRRPELLPGHLDDFLAVEPRPKAVWFQLGIQNDAVAGRLEGAGFEVVQDKCLLAEHRRLARFS